MKWFYNKSIQLMEERGGGISHGVWVAGQLVPVKTIACDIQPASREQIFKDYGYYIDCSKRVFCDIDTSLVAGAIVSLETENYKIVKIVEWDDYLDIFLELEG